MRKIYKFSDESIDKIRSIIQQGILDAATGKEPKTLEELKVLGFEPSEQELVPVEVVGLFDAPIKMSDKTLMHLSQLLSFSTMTRTNFVDLCRQIRLEEISNKYQTTEEYLSYFQDMISNRVEFAKLVKDTMQKAIANDSENTTPPEAA